MQALLYISLESSPQSSRPDQRRGYISSRNPWLPCCATSISQREWYGNYKTPFYLANCLMWAMDIFREILGI